MPVQKTGDWRRLFFIGACMGAADIVPGVSGGTMALICGIYEKLIESIKSLGTVDALSVLWLDLKRFKKKVPWDFLISVFSGIAFSLIIFSQAIHWLLRHPASSICLYALFWGMILASIAVCIWRVPQWERRLWTGLAAGAFLTLFFTAFRPQPIIEQQLYEVAIPPNLQYKGRTELMNFDSKRKVLKNVDLQTLAAMWAKGVVDSGTEVFMQGSGRKYAVLELVERGESHWFNSRLFLCGVVAVSAMLLPGISGSFLLMVLGAYPIVIAALADLVKKVLVLEWDADACFVLINVGLGIGVGAILFSRVVSWFLKKDHDMTMAVLIGFMAGSLRMVWPYRNFAWKLDPLKLADGPQLLFGDPYIPSIWGKVFWTSIPFLIAGAGGVFILNKLSEHTVKR